MNDIILDTLDENAMVDLIPVENNESVAKGNEEVIPESARIASSLGGYFNFYELSEI